MRFLCAVLLAVVLAITPTLGQTKDDPSGTNEVAGLKLPKAQTVTHDEGFVTVEADCKGKVKWLVLSTSAKIKFKVNPATPNEITVAIPPYESAITLFCIGIVDGKQTEFARTDVLVKGPAGPGPSSNPIPQDVKGPFHLSIIEDPARRSEAFKRIIDNGLLFKQLKERRVTTRVYAVNDPVVKEKKFDVVLRKYGAPMMILQDSTGKALVLSPLPPDPANLLKLVAPYTGEFK